LPTSGNGFKPRMSLSSNGDKMSDGKSGDLYRYTCKKCGKLFISNKKQEALSRRDKHELICRN